MLLPWLFASIISMMSDKLNLKRWATSSGSGQRPPNCSLRHQRVPRLQDHPHRFMQLCHDAASGRSIHRGLAATIRSGSAATRCGAAGRYREQMRLERTSRRRGSNHCARRASATPQAFAHDWDHQSASTAQGAGRVIRRMLTVLPLVVVAATTGTTDYAVNHRGQHSGKLGPAPGGRSLAFCAIIKFRRDCPS